MKEIKAIQNLIAGNATDEEINLIKQGIINNEISVGGSISQSVIIIGDGNTVKLTPEAIEQLGARPLLQNSGQDFLKYNAQYTLDESHMFMSKFINKQKETPSLDPYSEYLISQYMRIEQFLKAIFQTSSGGLHDIIKPLMLQYLPLTGVVNGNHEITPLKLDPLVNVLGKRFKKDDTNYSDLRSAYLDYKGRILLTGEKGSGKTISLLTFGIDCIIRRLQNPDQPLPILGVIPTWNYKENPPISKWLQESYGAPNDIENLLTQGKALLILDGLDELVPDIHTSFDPQALFLESLPANNHIVLACRFHTSTFLKKELRLNGAVSVEPVSEIQALEYISQFPKLKKYIKSDSSVLSLLDTPIFLTLFTEAYHNSDAKNLTVVEQLPDSLDKKYEIIEHVIDNRRKRLLNSDKFTLDKLKKSFGAIAYKMTMKDPLANPYHLSFEEIETTINDDTKVFISNAESMGLLVQSNENAWRFSHLFYQEYFTFNHCLDMIQNLPQFFRGVEAIVYIAGALDVNFFALDYHKLKIEDNYHTKKIIDRCVDFIVTCTTSESGLEELIDVCRLLSQFEEKAAYAIKDLLSHPDEFVSFNALYILSLNLQPFSVKILSDALAEFDSKKRHITINRIKDINNPILAPLFLHCLNDKDSSLWLQATEGLILYEDIASNYLEEATDNITISDSLKIYKQSGSAPAFDFLVRAFNNGEWANNSMLGLAMYLFADDQTLFRIKELLPEAHPKNAQYQFIYSIMSFIAKKFPESTKKLLEDENAYYRQIAIIFLSHIDDEHIISLLLSVFDDPDRYVRLEAARALIKFGPGMLKVLEFKLFEKQSEFNSYEDLLGKSKDIIKRCLTELSTIATDEKLYNRQHLLVTLIAILGKIQPENIPLVINSMAKKEEEYRMLARESLIIMGQHADAALKVAIKSHKDVKVRSDIRFVLSNRGIDE